MQKQSVIALSRGFVVINDRDWNLVEVWLERGGFQFFEDPGNMMNIAVGDEISVSNLGNADASASWNGNDLDLYKRGKIDV